MKRSPSEAWYILAAGIVLAAMAIAAFDFGSSVRSLIEPTQWGVAGSTGGVSLEAGESRALYVEVDRSTGPSLPTCEVGFDDQSVPLSEVARSSADVEVNSRTWEAFYTFEAPSTGNYTVVCLESDWAVAPTFGVDGEETVSAIAEWVVRFSLIFLPGLLMGAALAGFIAWRRHRSVQPLG